MSDEQVAEGFKITDSWRPTPEIRWNGPFLEQRYESHGRDEWRRVEQVNPTAGGYVQN